VPLPVGALDAASAAALRADYEARYERQFGLRIPDVPVEFLTRSVNVSTVSGVFVERVALQRSGKATSTSQRNVFDPLTGKRESVPVFLRKDCAPGSVVAGPALIAEPQTTTLLPRGWRCSVAPSGELILERET
jgi:N-methylhydantoinase A